MISSLCLVGTFHSPFCMMVWYRSSAIAMTSSLVQSSLVGFSHTEYSKLAHVVYASSGTCLYASKSAPTRLGTGAFR
jgi:hypothetical protein